MKANAANVSKSSLKALIGGTIIDGNGGAPIKDGVIVIDGNRIVAVGSSSTPIPNEADIISVDRNQYIIPGLYGVAHLVWDSAYLSTLLRFEERYEDIALETAQIALKRGITWLESPGYEPWDALVKVRDTINGGRAIGPRLWLAGAIIGWGGPVSQDMFPSLQDMLPPLAAKKINGNFECGVGEELWGMSPSMVRDRVRKLIESGADWLHVAINARYGVEEFFRFSPRVMEAIVDDGHRANLVVKAHCMYSEEGVFAAFNAGYDLAYISGGVQVSKPMSAELIEEFAKRDSTIFIRPINKGEESYLDAFKSSCHNPRYNELNPDRQGNFARNARLLMDAGVPMAIGAGGRPYSPEGRAHPANAGKPDEMGIVGKDHVHAFKGALELGMKPMEILRAATIIPAKAYKLDRDLGTLEPGKFADLLILDGDPLGDVENYRSISVVMKDGEIIDRDALPNRPVLTAESA